MIPSRIRKRIERPEEALQRSVVQFLDRALPKRALYWHAHQNPKNKAEGGRLKGLGLRAGMPDLCILYDGRLYGIELKAAKGKLSEAQSSIADKFSDNGAFWTVARTVDGVEAFLRAAGMQLRGSVLTIEGAGE